LNRAIRGDLAGRVPRVVGKGTARRNYIHVDDVADTIIHCLAREVEGVRWLGGTEILSIAEIMRRVCAAFCDDAIPEFVEGPEARDQIVETSDDLPGGRSMSANLERERRRAAATTQ
jgi:nucleoside-diphosphate-sugar epimerase